MMTASILAKRANVPIFTVRYYTRIGLLKPSRDLRNGYKIYKHTDRERLRFIAAAKELGRVMSAPVTLAPTRATARDVHPVPVARSRTRSPGLGSRRRTQWAIESAMPRLILS